MACRLSDEALEQLFRAARSHNGFLSEEISDEALVAIYDLMKWGPTAANGQPARFLFIRSPEAKARLLQALHPGNVAKTLSAPVTVVVARDIAFYEHLPRLFPHTDARSWYEGNEALIEETSFLNAALGGAYFLLAARALGWDCGPMAGFDRALLDELFFAGTSWRSLFLINLGHGDPTKLFERLPRFNFDEVCRIV